MSVLKAILLLVCGVTARKTYLVKSENNLALQPKVLAYDCNKYIFQTATTYAAI